MAVDNPEGMRFQVFYSAQVLPYICILDPRTGEEKVGYNGFNKTSKEFELELLKFISQTPYPNAEEGDAPHELNPVDFNVSLIIYAMLALFLIHSRGMMFRSSHIFIIPS